ncbi:MAG: GlsB/YeaQ/YmgE family stress response membrane protein [Chloroflexi bacterium]|nr:GlsB/YeaQ/YmgE family stress response membrane protein [Chloroflexota bacterium]
MDILNLIAWVVVGAISGWLASIVMKTNATQGLLMDIVVGIAGGFIGGFVLNQIGVGTAVTGLNLASVLVAFIGAVILLGILRLVRRGR